MPSLRGAARQALAGDPTALRAEVCEAGEAGVQEHPEAAGRPIRLEATIVATPLTSHEHDEELRCGRPRGVSFIWWRPAPALGMRWRRQSLRMRSPATWEGQLAAGAADLEQQGHWLRHSAPDIPPVLAG